MVRHVCSAVCLYYFIESHSQRKRQGSSLTFNDMVNALLHCYELSSLSYVYISITFQHFNHLSFHYLPTTISENLVHQF